MTDLADAGDASNASPIASFWMGGFEGADHLDAAGCPLDMATANGHVAQLDGDHARAAALGLRSVRESIGWRLAEPSPGVYDLSRARRIALSARRHGLQVAWTLMHYGTPADLSVFDDAMVPRFVRFAVEVARVLAPLGSGPPVFNLINEIGYLAWAASQPGLMSVAPGARQPEKPLPDPPSGATAEFTPEGAADRHAESTLESGFSVKRRLARATIEATAAIKSEHPGARFLQIEPLVHVEPPRDRPDLAPLARQISDYQWQVWDLLSGRLEPALGGHEELLDLIGVNYYHSGQWEVLTEQRLDWRVDPRRRPFSALLHDAWTRYRRPVVVAETGHVGEGRATWFDEVADEVRTARREGVPILGMCLYPLIDRPDWNDAGHWHHSGLWDVDRRTVPPMESSADRPFRRVLCAEYAQSLQRWQAALGGGAGEGRVRDCVVVFLPRRWGAGHHRTPQLMTQLSRHYRVICVEAPKPDEGAPRLERIALGPHMELLVPHLPSLAGGCDDEQMVVLESMLADALHARSGTARWIAWFATPMALPLLASLPRLHAVVCDCGDDSDASHLAGYFYEREMALLKMADLVFIADRHAVAAGRVLHPKVRLLPDAVDRAHHAARHRDAGNAHAFDVRKLQQDFPSPRLGFFGTINEGFDAALVAAVADARPQWQMVIVGPVVDRDVTSLPQRPNIHWLGVQSYLRLPHFLASWDVCLLPFVAGHLSPGACPMELLAYVASARPVVSTHRVDPAARHGGAVRTATTRESFVIECDLALAESGAGREQHALSMRAAGRLPSWQQTAFVVHGLLQQTLMRASAQPSSEPEQGASTHFEAAAAPVGRRAVSRSPHEQFPARRHSAP